jgi:hypothetical protein
MEINAPNSALIISMPVLQEGRAMPASHVGNVQGPARKSMLRWWQDYAKPSTFFDFGIYSKGELKRADSADLLERRIEALSLEPSEIVDPLMFRELQQRCLKCAARDQCALDFADEFADPAWQYWRNYCPNAAILTMLSTFQSCSRAHK